LYVLKLRAAVGQREDAAIPKLLDLLGPATQDLRVGRDVGLALVERVREIRLDDPLPAAERSQWQERAMALLDRSLRTEAHDPEAAWGYGLLAAALKRDLEPALQRLKKIEERVPMNADLESATALIYESMQQPEQAVEHFSNSARFSHSMEERQWWRAESMQSGKHPKQGGHLDAQ
jgi:tetratricopeptide (TPR) repeat protein